MKSRETCDIVRRGAGQKSGLTRMSLTALGVVFGDIGTSPLYKVRVEKLGPGFSMITARPGVYGGAKNRYHFSPGPGTRTGFQC